MLMKSFAIKGGGIQLHTFLADFFKEIHHGLFEDRVQQVRGQFSQGDQDKTPLMQTGMGDGQARLVKDLVPIEEYIDVDDPRAHRNGLFPSHSLLDPLQKGMEGMGSKGRGHLCHTIDKPVLIVITDGFCFIKGGNGVYMIVVRCGYLLKGTQTLCYLVADV
jgi:hypothetical protein